MILSYPLNLILYIKNFIIRKNFRASIGKEKNRGERIMNLGGFISKSVEKLKKRIWGIYEIALMIMHKLLSKVNIKFERIIIK